MTTSATTTPITASAAASDLKYLSTLIEESPDSTVNKITSKLSMTTLEEIKVIKEMYSSKIMEVMEPTKQQLFQYGLNMGIPFIGFGIMDNAIMIIAGDKIDASLGVMFAISTMCAAAIGNIISDLAGVLCGTAIEDFANSHLGLKDPGLSRMQMKLRSVRFAGQFGCAIGITIGCIIGMFPLLWIDDKTTHAMKREEALNKILQDVMVEAKELVSAEGTQLFLVDEGSQTLQCTNSGSNSNDYALGSESRPVKIPIGPSGGIVGISAQTHQPELIHDTQKDSRFDPKSDNANNSYKSIKTMLCVPVCDNEGRVIAVIQAVNKCERPSEADTNKSKRRNRRKLEFTWYDEFLLQNLANHVSVSLQELDNPHDDRLGKAIELMQKTERHEHHNKDRSHSILRERQTRVSQQQKQ